MITVNTRTIRLSEGLCALVREPRSISDGQAFASLGKQGSLGEVLSRSHFVGAILQPGENGSQYRSVSWEVYYKGRLGEYPGPIHEKKSEHEPSTSRRFHVQWFGSAGAPRLRI